MFCNKCGNKVNPGEKFCGACGNKLVQEVNIEPNNDWYGVKKNHLYNDFGKKKMVIIAFCIVSIVLIVGTFVYVNNKNNYYFTDEPVSDDTGSDTKGSSSSTNQTVIVYDNYYEGVSISTRDDAMALIEKDSVSQKNKCPKDIVKIEKEFINKYKIDAVNLCEMDVDFARELETVFEKIYKEYPGARGYITNLTLWNTDFNNRGVIAAFMPVFHFATSNTTTGYPWVIKTHVFLSSRYFLQKDVLKNVTKASSESGHFPPNSDIYSPLAHELGHYLSFLAMMKHYEIDSILLIDGDSFSILQKLVTSFSDGSYSLDMLKTAYENYKKDTKKALSFDEFRGSISGYALAKDNNGEYIYDETIAEAFHDTYLNGDRAKDASKYIVKVLKERLG